MFDFLYPIRKGIALSATTLNQMFSYIANIINGNITGRCFKKIDVSRITNALPDTGGTISGNLEVQGRINGVNIQQLVDRYDKILKNVVQNLNWVNEQKGYKDVTTGYSVSQYKYLWPISNVTTPIASAKIYYLLRRWRYYP